jgi:hypothetical protein
MPGFRASFVLLVYALRPELGFAGAPPGYPLALFPGVFPPATQVAAVVPAS